MRRINLLRIFMLLILLPIEFCLAVDKYSLAIKMNTDISIMLIYKDNNDTEISYEDIVNKTYCGILETMEPDENKTIEEIIGRNRALIKIGISNLRNQIIKENSAQSMYYVHLENVIVGFLEQQLNKQETTNFSVHLQASLKADLQAALALNKFSFNPSNIILVDSNNMLAQAAIEYLYNTGIDKTNIDNILASSVETKSKNITIATNRVEKKPMTFTLESATDTISKKDNLGNYMFHMFSSFGILNFNNIIKDTHTIAELNKKLFLENKDFLIYKIYKLINSESLDTILVPKFSSLSYSPNPKSLNVQKYGIEVIDENNQIKENFFLDLIKTIQANVKIMHETTLNKGVDYTIVMGEYLLNNIVRNIYFQQVLKLKPKIRSDKIYILNIEDFYCCLASAAKTTVKQYKKYKSSEKPPIPAWGVTGNDTFDAKVDKTTSSNIQANLNNEEQQKEEESVQQKNNDTEQNKEQYLNVESDILVNDYNDKVYNNLYVELDQQIDNYGTENIGEEYARYIRDLED